MNIVIDIDDVALDWLGGFEAYVKSLGLKTKMHRPVNWDLNHWVEHGNVADLVVQFNASPLFEKLNPVDGAVKALEELAKYHTIDAITCCGDTDEVASARVANMRRHFGWSVRNIACLALGENKTPWLKEFAPGSFWIEDKWENAVHGADLGLRAILLDKPHNGGQKEDPRITRLHRWCDIVDHIKENA